MIFDALQVIRDAWTAITNTTILGSILRDIDDEGSREDVLWLSGQKETVR